MSDHALLTQVEALASRLLKTELVLTTAESCTGGMLSMILTEISGSSAWLDGGYVTYSNQAKVEMLGVSPQTLTRVGAVSEEIALEMALGSLYKSKDRAKIAVSITGIAGPSGGSAEKPVGTVCFGWAKRHGPAITKTYHFSGDRHSIREQATLAAIEGLLQIIA